MSKTDWLQARLSGYPTTIIGSSMLPTPGSTSTPSIALISGISTFSADLYFWMRYAPRDDIASVDFPDLIRGKFDPEAPVSQEITDGLVHRLYRIKGEFKNDFKLQDYPFDAQRLTIRLVNTAWTRDQVVYAVDSVGLDPRSPPRIFCTVIRKCFSSGVFRPSPISAMIWFRHRPLAIPVFSFGADF